MTAALALKAARGKSNKRASGGPDRHTRRNLNGLSPEETAEELQARKADAKWAADERKAGRDPDRSSDEPQSSAPASTSPAPSSSSSSMDAVHTGGGFLLGLGLWVVFVNYMQGGVPQVKRLAAAKLLNRTGG